MGNFFTFLFSDTLESKYKIIIQDIDHIKEKFDQLDFTKIEVKDPRNNFETQSLYDCQERLRKLMYQLHYPSSRKADKSEIVKDVKSILTTIQNLNMNNEKIIQEIENDIISLVSKVSLFIIDDQLVGKIKEIQQIKDAQVKIIDDIVTIVKEHSDNRKADVILHTFNKSFLNNNSRYKNNKRNESSNKIFLRNILEKENDIIPISFLKRSDESSKQRRHRQQQQQKNDNKSLFKDRFPDSSSIKIPSNRFSNRTGYSDASNPFSNRTMYSDPSNTFPNREQHDSPSNASSFSSLTDDISSFPSESQN